MRSVMSAKDVSRSRRGKPLRLGTSSSATPARKCSCTLCRASEMRRWLRRSISGCWRTHGVAALPVDVAVLRRRLKRLQRCVRTLRTLQAQGRAAFESDESVQDRAEHNAQLTARACVDIAIDIVSPLGPDELDDYCDPVLALAQVGVVPTVLAARICDLTVLIGTLADNYLDIEHGGLFDALAWVDDAAAFGKAVERWLALKGRRHGPNRRGKRSARGHASA